MSIFKSLKVCFVFNLSTASSELEMILIPDFVVESSLKLDIELPWQGLRHLESDISLKKKGQRSRIASENRPGQKIDTFSSRLAKADLQNRNNDNNNVLCSKQSFGNDIPIRNTKINIFITIITATIGNVITIIFLVIFSKSFTSSSSSSSSSPSSSHVPSKHLQMTFPSETCPGLLPPVSKPGYNMFSKYFI